MKTNPHQPSDEPVMIVPLTEYRHLCARVTEMEQRYEGAEPDFRRARAERFMEALDLARADQWGHIAYCIDIALRHLP